MHKQGATCRTAQSVPVIISRLIVQRCGQHHLEGFMCNQSVTLLQGWAVSISLRPAPGILKWARWILFYLHMEGLLFPRRAHRLLLGFPLPFFFFLLLFNPEGNTGRTRKGIKFWIERLIINLSRELILGVLGRSWELGTGWQWWSQHWQGPNLTGFTFKFWQSQALSYKYPWHIT